MGMHIRHGHAHLVEGLLRVYEDRGDARRDGHGLGPQHRAQPETLLGCVQVEGLTRERGRRGGGGGGCLLYTSDAADDM
eukprot:3044475-Prymnesium_polylepis.1